MTVIELPELADDLRFSVKYWSCSRCGGRMVYGVDAYHPELIPENRDGVKDWHDEMHHAEAIA